MAWCSCAHGGSISSPTELFLKRWGVEMCETPVLKDEATNMFECGGQREIFKDILRRRGVVLSSSSVS